jgi:asparagine synthase (glutamine-hydrolysing)
MAAALRHRGPDDPGLERRPDAAVGCERLRITDPRPEASQPFVETERGIWLVVNGAVYNAAALRARFPAFPYRSRSDVEPLLPLYLEAGDDWVETIDGMFALAVWDAAARQLVLARDRAGEKPLFYLRAGDEVWFASEVSALLSHPTVGRTEDREAMRQFLALGYVSGAATAFEHVRQVAPGTVHTFAARGESVRRYWTPETIVPVTWSPQHAADRLDQLLRSALETHLAADVPYGFFTSGGVDSSLLVALAARARGPARIRTFAVGFPHHSYDERGDARYVAALFDTEHVEVEATESALTDALQTVTDRVAEPLADPAILPTLLLAREACRHVGVVLGGEGADELFGGYPTYIGHRIAPWFLRLPPPIMKMLAAAIDALPSSQAKVPLEFLLKRFVAGAHRPVLQRHLMWFGTGLLPLLHEPDAVIDHTLQAARATLRDTPNGIDPVHRCSLLDYGTYLPDDLLLKVDRATMLHSLEARAPYLGRDLSRFAFGLSAELKVRGFETKRLLKRVAARYLPLAIVRRRKRGLGVPIAGWLNGGLRAHVDHLLATEPADGSGLLNTARLAQLVSEHRTGRANHARALWTWLIYRRWRRRWLGE